jgi:putative ABC transport system permease protein
MRAVRLLNLRRVRRQPLRAVITVVAVGAGVSLAISIVVVSNSLTAGFENLSRSLAGPTPLRVVGATVRGGIDESVVGAVRTTPGVAAAVPTVQAVTMAQDGKGHERPILAFGVDCSIQELLGPIGCDPAAIAAATDGPPLLSTALARDLGPKGAIRTDLGRLPIGPSSDKLDSLNHGRVAVFPLPAAQRQFVRPGTLDVIYVKPAPGTDLSTLRTRLQQAIGPQNGVLGTTDPPAEVGVVKMIYIPLFSILSLFSLGVGAVLIYNTVTLSLEERRRHLAIVGALGASPRLLLGGTLAEAALLGLVGGLLGSLAGVGVAHPVIGSINDFTEKGLGMPIPVAVAGRTIVIGAVLGMVLALAAAWVPARRALRVDVAAELSNRDLRAETAPEARWRRVGILTTLVIVGLVLCRVGSNDGAIEPWQATVAPLAFLLASVATFLLVGALAPIVIGAVSPRMRKASAAARLGLANLTREPGRTGVMAIAIGSAVGIAFGIATFNQSVHDGIHGNLASSDADWVWVSTLEPNNTVNIDAKITPALTDAVRQVPGVASAGRSIGLISGHEAGTLIGVDGDEGHRPSFPMLRGGFDEARFQAGEVMIGPGLARSTGARPGDSVTLDTPKGQVPVHVMGIWQNGDFGGRNVLMAVPHIERLFGPQPPYQLLVRPAAGVSLPELASRIRAAHLDPALQVLTPKGLADTSAADIGNQLSSFWALQRSMLLVAFVAVLSTLLLVGVQRRRELGLLAAVGMAPRELARMIVSEAGAVAVTGIGLGVLAGLVMSMGTLAVTLVLIGYKDPLAFAWPTIPGSAAIGAAIVLLASAFPAWRTSRLQVVEALQYE